MRFEELNLHESLLRAVRNEGYTEPTPIQEQAIPHVLAGRDLLGCAQTGTGKTAAFALPILQLLGANSSNRHNGNNNGKQPIRALVISPTRELATQIGESFRVYGRNTSLKFTTVYGGVSPKSQIDRLRRGIDVLIATPGRLLDLKNQGQVRLDKVEILVLDEADRMLDMGFLPDVRKIINAVPNKRQTLFFSATMPGDIQHLADSILTDPVRVSVTPQATTVEAIDQSVYFVDKGNKRALLEHLLQEKDMPRTLIFMRTKHTANRLAKQLSDLSVRADAIHGNKSQNAREQALANFKRGKIQVLVATDIAARGLDVENISHVINYDLPNETESYVHRIGRTGRAGMTGVAYSFCSGEERDYLRDIERLIRMRIPVVSDHPYVSSSKSSNGNGASNSTQANGNGNGRSSSQRNGSNGSNGNANGNGSKSGGSKNHYNRRRNQNRNRNAVPQ